MNKSKSGNNHGASIARRILNMLLAVVIVTLNFTKEKKIKIIQEMKMVMFPGIFMNFESLL